MAHKDRIYTPEHNREAVKTFAPRLGQQWQNSLVAKTVLLNTAVGGGTLSLSTCDRKDWHVRRNRYTLAI